MCVHFQLKAKGCLFYLCFYNQSISIQQHEFSSPDRKQINISWAHVSSLVSSTTSPRWAPASTTWRSWRTSPARWWVTTSEVLTKFAKFRWQHYCTYCRLTADNSENDIVCDQKVCVHHCLLWPVTSMPAAEMSDKTLLAVAPSSPPPLDHETQWHNVNGIPVLSRVQPRYSSHTSFKPEVIEKWQLLWLGWEVVSQETRGNGNIYLITHISKLMITVGLPRRRPGSAVGVAGGRGGPCTPAPATTCSTPASTASTATTSTTTPQLNTSQTENLGQTYFSK